MELGVCFRKFFMVTIVIINAIVAILGLVLLIYGGVSLGQGKNYFAITDNATTFTRVPVLMIIVGLFITIVGAVGAIGALFSSTAFGRVMLLVYCVILALLLICEIGGGIAAGVLRSDVEKFFSQGANITFGRVDPTARNDYYTTWNNFQQSFSCCGVNSYLDWKTVLNTDPPASCCPTSTPTCDSTTYFPGCVPKLVGDLKTYFGGIAAGAIIIALLQIAAIFASAFVTFYKPKDKYEVV